MSITSFDFIFFISILIVVYFLTPAKYKWVSLLVFSIYFYTVGGIQPLFYVLLVSVISYISAIGVELINARTKSKISQCASTDEKTEVRKESLIEKQRIAIAAIVFILGIWSVIKFGRTSIIVPLGISFFTFHATGYIIDVYRGKYDAEKNFFKFLLFISFFPHIIQGPFSRYDSLKKTIYDAHTFSYDRLCLGTRRILWGYFKKLLVADKLGVAIDNIFSNSSSYPGVYIAVAALSYGFQLYADFSGYMDIMCGVCEILGVELSENFKQPYFSKSVEEFWQRWHITLGTWFKDYVFSPIAMGKIAQELGHRSRKKWGARAGKYIPGYFALVFVWTLTGFWHGATFSYVFWGWLNLLVIMISMQCKPLYTSAKEKLHINDKSWWWKTFQVIRTFLLITFFRFFSYGYSFMQSLNLIKKMFYNNLYVAKDFYGLFVGMETKDVKISLIGIIAIILVDIAKEFKWKVKVPTVTKALVYASMLVLLIYAGGGSNDLIGGFMYAAF